MGSQFTTISAGNKFITIPCLGFGTAAPALADTNEMREAILEAIRLGYRHFDTASLYGTEPSLGEAIAQALKSGLIKSREELFVTTKLWASDAHCDHVKPALQNSLKRLRLEYVDLFLIHWPIAFAEPGNTTIEFDQKLLAQMDYKPVWEAMEECQELGLTKSIGVCNFSVKKLDNLLATARIPPVVNQVEISPVWQQKKLRGYCLAKGIHITAYSPLGAKGAIWGTNRVMDSPTLNQIATLKDKTVAQICLRWVYEQGVSLLVKSRDKNRIKENFDIFDWNLTPEELQKISELPQTKACLARALNFICEEGPFKSEEELWDEAI